MTKYGWCLVMPESGLLVSYPVFGSKKSANNAVRLAYKSGQGNKAIASGVYESSTGRIEDFDMSLVDFSEIQPITRQVAR